MLRFLTKKRKRERKEANHLANADIYARGATTFPADYLTVHQPSEPERVAKIKAAAELRRQQRQQKRITNA